MLLGRSLSREINGFRGRPSHYLGADVALTIRMRRRRDFTDGVIQLSSVVPGFPDLSITSMMQIEEHGTLVIGGARSASNTAVV